MKYLNKRKKNKSFDLIESHYDDTEDYNTEYI